MASREMKRVTEVSAQRVSVVIGITEMGKERNQRSRHLRQGKRGRLMMWGRGFLCMRVLHTEKLSKLFGL